ncbi:MAG: alpha/beta hydrolase [Acetobacteraceae bacterium]|nr:alpha/beta hydrolase [Acetobacteraceae bacterium]MDW8399501.1 alpha/beta hydrolase [Acetobacteraceae bacterium]
MEPIVYRGMTRAELDSAYDNQRHVPEVAEWIAEYGRRSAAARARLKTVGPLAYGPGARQAVDLYLPARLPAPVHVFLHGGAWRALSREEAAWHAEGVVAQGSVFAAVGFDLATEVRLSEMVRQARQAVAWLYRNVAAHGGDPERITIGGHSSGAHMAAMVARDDWQEAAGLPRNLLKGAYLLSGLYDLEPVRLSYRNALLRLTEAEAAALSPILGRPSCPVVVGVAERETPEFRRQCFALAAEWGARFVFDAAGRHHYDVALDMGDPATVAGAALARVLAAA